MWLPDDVSIRTSDHHGTVLRNAYELWGHWVSLVLDIQQLTPSTRDDALHLAAGARRSDEWQAST